MNKEEILETLNIYYESRCDELFKEIHINRKVLEIDYTTFMFRKSDHYYIIYKGSDIIHLDEKELRRKIKDVVKRDLHEYKSDTLRDYKTTVERQLLILRKSLIDDISTKARRLQLVSELLDKPIVKLSLETGNKTFTFKESE